MGVVYDPWAPGTHHCDPPQSRWVKIFQRYETDKYDVGTVWECDTCGEFYRTRIYGHGAIVWEPMDPSLWDIESFRRRAVEQSTTVVKEVKAIETTQPVKKPWYERWFG